MRDVATSVTAVFRVESLNDFQGLVQLNATMRMTAGAG